MVTVNAIPIGTLGRPQGEILIDFIHNPRPAFGAYIPIYSQLAGSSSYN